MQRCTMYDVRSVMYDVRCTLCTETQRVQGPSGVDSGLRPTFSYWCQYSLGLTLYYVHSVQHFVPRCLIFWGYHVLIKDEIGDKLTEIFCQWVLLRSFAPQNVRHSDTGHKKWFVHPIISIGEQTILCATWLVLLWVVGRLNFSHIMVENW